jgi:hypothetical protein
VRIPMKSAGDSEGRRPSVPRQSGRVESERSDAGFFPFSEFVLQVNRALVFRMDSPFRVMR